MSDKSHWENVYQTKLTTQVIWFQEHAERGLPLTALLAAIDVEVLQRYPTVGGQSFLPSALQVDLGEAVLRSGLPATAHLSAQPAWYLEPDLLPE